MLEAVGPAEEADGSQHADNNDDARRYRFHRGERFRILRFWNHQVRAESASVAAPTVGASIGAVAVGLLAAGFGLLAATAQGMATAPSRGAGLVPLLIVAAGLALALLGIASLPVPGLRRAAKTGAIAILAGFVGLYVLSQLLSATGLYGG